MKQLSLTLFGGFTAVTPQNSSLHFPTDKARALLAYLALMADRPLRREMLAGLLWPEQPEALARQNLRQTLSRLRSSLDQAQPGLGERLLTVTRQTVALHGQVGTADVAQFEEHLAAVQAHQHGSLVTCLTCLVMLETAVALYRRGDFLAGLSLPDASPFEAWLLLQRERLYQSQLTALHQLVTAYEQQGAWEAAYRYALWQIEIEPWREEAHRQAMRLLASNGQRSQALAQYESCCRILAEELGLEPAAETVQLWQQIKEKAAQMPAVRQTQTYHFPTQLTPFVGREETLAEILAVLQDTSCRVLTLVGAGGMGKTRLSVQVGRLLAEEGATRLFYRDGAFFVSLTAVNDQDLLITALAQAFGLQLTELITPQQQLLSYLQDKELLLVGDNFEQIEGGAALIANIVAAAPRVQLLLTSQQPLHIQAERRLAVAGLAYADASEPSEAAQLFLANAQRVHPGFQLTESELPALLELCRLLDGMPLALEIAAGWVRMMDCATILRETKRSLDFLVSPLQDMPARHQSLRAVLARSWQLLPLALQEALQRIALFTGGFRLEAALATMPDVSMADLAALLDKALLTWRPDGRYQMHQLLRTFVRQQAQTLEQQQAERLFRQRYGRYYLEFVTAQEPKLRGQNPQQAIALLQDDLPNLRQAFRLALEERLSVTLTQAMSGLGHFYHLTGLFEEAEQGALAALAAVAAWEASEETAVLQTHLHLQASHFLGQGSQFRQAIEQARQAQTLATQLRQTALLARAFGLEGEWWRHLSELDKAKKCLETAVSLHPAPSRNNEYARTLNQLGQIHTIQSQYDEALLAFNQARHIYETLGDQTEMWGSLGHMAEVYRLKADYPQALAYSQQALQMAEAIGYKQAVVKNAIILSTIQLDQGELDLARTTAHNALQVARELGYLQGIINSHICLGNVSIMQGKLDEAEQWLQMARLQAEEVGLQDLLALALGRLGVIQAHRGEHEAAILAYQQAMQLSRLLANQMEFGRNLGNLGNIYLRMGEYERALSYFEQALAAMQAIGARQAAANMMMRMGNVYKRTGNYERAVIYFEQSLAICERIQHKSSMATNLGWLGVMHYEMGQYEAALARYEQAQVLSEEIGDQITRAIWLLNRAQASMYLGRREAAERLAQEGVAVCRTVGNSRFLPGAMIHQAEIFFTHGKFEQAQLVLAEGLSLSEATGDQLVQFDGRILQARLYAHFGQQETAVSYLRAMLPDFAGDAYQAQIYYYLWQLEGDEGVRETAVTLYETRLAHSPNHKLQQQLKKLHDRARDARAMGND